MRSVRSTTSVPSLDQESLRSQDKRTVDDVARVHVGEDISDDETVELRLLVRELARTAQMREHLASGHHFHHDEDIPADKPKWSAI